MHLIDISSHLRQLKMIPYLKIMFDNFCRIYFSQLNQAYPFAINEIIKLTWVKNVKCFFMDFSNFCHIFKPNARAEDHFLEKYSWNNKYRIEAVH